MSHISLKLSMAVLLSLLSNFAQAANCLDVFSSASQADSAHSLNLLANAGGDGNLVKSGNAQDTYTPGDYFHLVGQLRGNYQLQAPNVTSRLYFTSLSTSGTVSINTANNSQNLIILVDGDIAISGNNSFNAIIYATGTITLGGNAHVNGAVTALGAIKIKSNASITYNKKAIEQADFASLCSNGSNTAGQFAFGRSKNPRVTFEQAFTVPPVVILMPTINSSAPLADGPSNLQLTSVTTTGFQFTQIEPSGNQLSSQSMPEIDWLAFAPGLGTLPDGHQYEAGIATVSNYKAKGGGSLWGKTNLSASFARKPELFHQQQSQKNNCWLSSVINERNRSSFNLALELSEVFNNSGSKRTCPPDNIKLSSLAPEKVGWVALEAHTGSYTKNGKNIIYQVGHGQNSHNLSDPSLVEQCAFKNSFNVSFNSPPILIAKKKTRKGSDGGWLRRCALSKNSFSIVVDEDQYQGSERSHLREELSFFALSAPANAAVPGLRFENTQTDALTCDPHAITVQALLDKQADESYVGTIHLSTSTGLGTWALSSGSGKLNPGNNDGLASYSFNMLDKGKASFTLFHSLEGDVNVQAVDGAISDDLTITYRPFGFRTSIDNSVPIFIANTNSTISLQAVGKDESTGACKVITNYDGNKNISLWSDYIEPYPSAGTKLKVNGNEIANYQSTASPQSILFEQGLANLSLNYPDAGKLKLNSKDATGIAPPSGGTGGAIIGGSTFIVNPLALYFSELKNAKGLNNSSGNATGGAGFSAAGENFSGTVTAVMNKGSVSCSELVAGSGYCITPSFKHNSLKLTHQLMTPTTGNSGNLNGENNKPAIDGQTRFEQINYSEVGSIKLNVIAQNYLTTGNHITGQSLELGRFYPDHILLNSSILTPACNNFSYLDQEALNVDYQLHALNRMGDLTLNYHWPDYSLKGMLAYYSGDALNDLSLRLNLTGSNGHWTHGKYSVSNEQLAIYKLASPDGPFNNVTLALQFTGHDGETISDSDFNPTSPNCNASNTCLAKSLGNAGDFYYGRLAPVNGFGSELAAITVSQRIELYNEASKTFIVNNFDSCSQLPLSAFSLTPSNGSSSMKIGSGSSALTTQAPNSGLLPLVFSAPGEGNRGSGYFTIDLLNTFPWLRFDWDENALLDNTVTGSVTFGVYKASQRLIYRKEQGM